MDRPGAPWSLVFTLVALLVVGAAGAATTGARVGVRTETAALTAEADAELVLPPPPPPAPLPPELPVAPARSDPSFEMWIHPPARTVAPGAVGTYTLVLHAREDVTVDLLVEDASPGFMAWLDAHTLTLKNGTNASARAHVAAPAEHDRAGNATFAAVARGEARQVASVVLRTTPLPPPPPAPALGVEIAPASREAGPRETVTFDVRLHATRASNVTLEIARTSGGLRADLAARHVALPANASTTVPLHVHTPASAFEGGKVQVVVVDATGERHEFTAVVHAASRPPPPPATERPDRGENATATRNATDEQPVPPARERAPPPANGTREPSRPSEAPPLGNDRPPAPRPHAEATTSAEAGTDDTMVHAEAGVHIP